MNLTVKSIIISISLLSVYSCSEITNSVPMAPEHFEIQLIDTINNTGRINYRDELFYYLEKVSTIQRPMNIRLYPNPAIEWLQIELLIDEIAKYELSIDNLDAEKHSLYSLDKKPKGVYFVQYDFTSSDEIKHGIYRLYLAQDMQKVDSLNFIYCTAEQDEKIKREGLYFIATSFSDLNGIVKISRNVARWISEKFTRKLEDGRTLENHQITSKLFLKIYDSDDKLIYEGFIDIKDLTEKIKLPV